MVSEEIASDKELKEYVKRRKFKLLNWKDVRMLYSDEEYIATSRIVGEDD